MREKSLSILAITVFLMTPFVSMGPAFAFDGKVLFREVTTERATSDWISISGNKTHEFQTRIDGIAHINAIALETSDPSIIRVVINIVFHGEVGLRLILLETGEVLEESVTDYKTSNSGVIGTMSIDGPENRISFSRTVGCTQIMGIEIRINSFGLIKTVHGEIQWIKTWMFMDHEKIPVPPPPIPTP